MTQATAPTNASEQSAIAVRDQDYSPKAITIGDVDPTKVNSLIRTTTVVQSNPYLKPVIRQMLLDQPADTYPITQKKQGDSWVATEVGISAVGLANLASAAGAVDLPQASGRVDDGRDPQLVTYRATQAMRMPDGEWQVKTRECTVKLSQLEKEIRAAKTKKGKENTNYRTKKPEPWSDERIEAEISKELLLKEKFMERLAETGAKNRATRALLGLATKYTPAQMAKPFVFMAVVPDMSHPELRARMLDQATSAIGGLFGPMSTQQAPAPRLLGAGPSEADLAHGDFAGGDLTADELEGGATDDATVDGDFTEQDDETPAFIREAAKAQAAQPKAEPVKKLPAEQQLVADLRELGAQGDDPEALMSDDQGGALATIFAGWSEDVIKGGLKAAWPDTKLQNLSGSQARAIESVHERLGHDKFETTWRAMVTAAAKAEGGAA